MDLPPPKRNKTTKHKKAKPSKACDCFQSVLVMLSSCKMTGKVVLVCAFAATYVTLEGILIAMASHVNSVKDVVGEVHVTVLAVVQKLRVLDRQGRSWRAGLAVAYARGARVSTRLAAGTCHRTVVPLTVGGPRLGARGGGALRNACCHGGNHRLGRGLLHHEGLLVGAGHYIRGCGVLVFRWQTG